MKYHFYNLKNKNIYYMQYRKNKFTDIRENKINYTYNKLKGIYIKILIFHIFYLNNIIELYNLLFFLWRNNP